MRSIGFSRASLAGSLTLTVGLIVLVTTLAVSLAGYLSGRASIERQIHDRVTDLSRETLATTESYLRGRVDELRQMSTSSLQVASTTPAERARVIADFAEAFGSTRYADLSILDLAGNVVASNGAPQFDRTNPTIAGLRDSSRPGIIDAVKFADQSQDVFVVYAPLIDENGKRTGTLVGRLLPAELVTIVRGIPIDDSTALYLTDRGSVLAQHAGTHAPAFAGIARAVSETARPDGTDLDLPLTVTGSVEPRAALAPVRSLALRSAIIGFVVLVLAWFAATWSARRIGRPLELVRTAAHAFAGGHLDASVDPEALELRELHDLGSSFNTLAATMRDLVGGIGSASTAISATAREHIGTARTLLAGTQEQAIASGHISSALSELSANSRAIEHDCVALESSARAGLEQLDKLVGEVDSTNVALLQLTETIDRSSQAGRSLAQQSAAVADRARGVGARAEAAQVSADRGSASVRTLIGDITDVGAHLAQTVERLEHLADATAAAINAQVEVINDMAERSKLLALNAGIEAARAGQAGRGFSVIASELHLLAGGSKEAGVQVRQLVGSVVTETRDIVVRARTASTLAHGAIARAAETSDAIDRLVNDISQSTQSAREIGAIAGEQAERTADIGRATDDMLRMAHISASAAKAVGALSRDVRGAVDMATTVAAQVSVATREEAASLAIIEQSASDIERANGTVANAAQASFAASESLQREIVALSQRVDRFTTAATNDVPASVNPTLPSAPTLRLNVAPMGAA